MILKGKEAYTKTCNKGSQLLRKYMNGQWRNQRPLDSPPEEGKNTIGDGGSIALYTALLTLLTLFSLFLLFKLLHTARILGL